MSTVQGMDWKCPECGLDYAKVMPSDIAPAVRSYPRRYRSFVARPDDEGKPDERVRLRPEPDVWSALEYTAHVRDVLKGLSVAVKRMAIEDKAEIDPFAGIDTEDPSRDNTRPVDDVLDELESQAESFAAAVDKVKGDTWTRTATFPWGERNLLDTAINAVHEGSHHLKDVEKVLRAVS